jgi:RND family efflux transporter MFP subunit
MKRSAVVAGVVALAAIAGAGGWWATRATAPAPGSESAAKPGSAPAAAVASNRIAIELTSSDLAQASVQRWQRTLAVSGALEAADTALVKAKVAAELQALTVREGDRVARGQLIGRLDGTEFEWRLRQARDQADAAKAQLEIAERTLANNRALVDQGFISRNALDTAVSNASAARSSLAAANAAAEIAAKSLRDAEIRAPIAGLVSQRFAQPGERLGLDARIVEIVDLSRLELEAQVPPEDVLALRVGQAAQVRVDGLVEPVAAKIARLNPSAAPGTRTVAAYLQLAPHPALRHGLFARASIVVEGRESLVIPASALRSDKARPYVLAVEGAAGAQQAAERPVRAGARGEAGTGGEAVVEILEGLAPGSTVLRGTVGSLREGTRLTLPGATGIAAR